VTPPPRVVDEPEPLTVLGSAAWACGAAPATAAPVWVLLGLAGLARRRRRG